MQTSRLRLDCPECRSTAVIYSCTPNCCFNHVCADCGAAWEPATKAAGGKISDVVPPDPLPESTDPTVECAVCQSIAVYALPDSRLVCGSCGSLLELR